MKHVLNLIPELIGKSTKVETLFRVVSYLDNNNVSVTSAQGETTIGDGEYNHVTVDVDGNGRIVTLQQAILHWFTNTKPIIGMECRTIDGHIGTIIDMGDSSDYEHLIAFDTYKTLDSVIVYGNNEIMKKCFIVAVRIIGVTSIHWFTCGGVQLTENN